MSRHDEQEDAMRYDDRREERAAERAEEAVHARADEGAATFPCGISTNRIVYVGADDEVTCRDCLHELQRRRYDELPGTRYLASVAALQSAGPAPTAAVVHYAAGTTRMSVLAVCGRELMHCRDADDEAFARSGMHGDVTCVSCLRALAGVRR